MGDVEALGMDGTAGVGVSGKEMVMGEDVVESPEDAVTASAPDGDERGSVEASGDAAEAPTEGVEPAAPEAAESPAGDGGAVVSGVEYGGVELEPAGEGLYVDPAAGVAVSVGADVPGEPPAPPAELGDSDGGSAEGPAGPPPAEEDAPGVCAVHGGEMRATAGKYRWRCSEAPDVGACRFELATAGSE